MNLLSNRFALHTRAALLIPWLVNGTTPEEAEPAIREHIATCPQCREDYAEQLRVREHMATEGPLVFAAESSYQKLLARIRADDGDRHGGRHTRLASLSVAPAVRWLAAAVVVEALALGLGAWMWHSQTVTRAAPYLTLTSPSPSYDSGARVRAVFRTDMTLATLQKVLRGAGARIIDGPTAENVYTLGFARPPDSSAELQQRIDALRADSAVLFAEPVPARVR